MKYLHLIFFLLSLCHSFAQDAVDQLSKKYTDQAQEGLIRLHTRHREELTKIQNAAMELKDLTLANKANAKIKELDDEIRKLGGTPTEPKNSIARGEDRNAIVSTDAVFLPFKKDVVVFTNRGYKWIAVPLRFADYEFSSARSNQNLKFSVTKGGIVTILAETLDAAILSKDGWKEVAQADRELQKTFRTSILQKELAPGEYLIKSSDFLGIRLLRPVKTE